jgi:hypothetical protein
VVVEKCNKILASLAVRTDKISFSDLALLKNLAYRFDSVIPQSFHDSGQLKEERKVKCSIDSKTIGASVLSLN